ncbi:MAG: DUF2147 domain-containing protein [Roseovarius sp.]
MHVTTSFSAAALAVVISVGAASADPAKGTWLTGADAKGQVAHVDVYACGASLCGKIVRAFTSAGKRVNTPTVGTRVFWDMVSSGAGTYSGRAYVPAHNRDYAATMRLSGNSLRVKGCLGPVCQSQTWTRVR